MKFIKILESVGNRPIWVNPSHITLMTSNSAHEDIFFSNGRDHRVPLGTAEKIAEFLGCDDLTATDEPLQPHELIAWTRRCIVKEDASNTLRKVLIVGFDPSTNTLGIRVDGFVSVVLIDMASCFKDPSLLRQVNSPDLTGIPTLDEIREPKGRQPLTRNSSIHSKHHAGRASLIATDGGSKPVIKAWTHYPLIPSRKLSNYPILIVEYDQNKYVDVLYEAENGELLVQSIKAAYCFADEACLTQVSLQDLSTLPYRFA